MPKDQSPETQLAQMEQSRDSILQQAQQILTNLSIAIVQLQTLQNETRRTLGMHLLRVHSLETSRLSSYRKGEIEKLANDFAFNPLQEMYQRALRELLAENARLENKLPK